MGIYDRDYYRECRGFSAFDGRVQACYVLAAIYVCVFLIQWVTRDAAFAGRPKLPGPVTELLELKASKVLDGEVWRVVTYAFIHDARSPLPLVLNVLFLVWFGRQIEEMYGWKEFVVYYSLASFLAGLGFILTVAFGQNDGILIGPAGSITAVLFLYALHFPRRTILLFFVLPCPVWFVVAFYVVCDVAGFFDGRLHPAALAAHAVAAGFAVAYYHYSVRISGWLPGLPSRSGSARARPKLHLYRGETGEEQTAPAASGSGMPSSASMAMGQGPASSGGALSSLSMDEHLEAKLDKVLEKVKKDGQESLTDEERAVLFRASEIYRKRRKLGGN